MKNTSPPDPRSGVHPSHVLEIRLDRATWSRVVAAAQARGVTYSWVVRYCLFRFIKRSQPELYLGRRGAFGGPSGGALHRHRLCLYGSDELYIRQTAGLFNWTMTKLVRIALERNLGRLEGSMGRFSRASFYWLGIKIFADREFPFSSTKHTTLRYIRFPTSEYW